MEARTCWKNGNLGVPITRTSRFRSKFELRRFAIRWFKVQASAALWDLSPTPHVEPFGRSGILNTSTLHLSARKPLTNENKNRNEAGNKVPDQD